MPYKKQWNWDKAVEGMKVVVEDLLKAKISNGVVKEIERSNKCRMVDGRPVKSAHVGSMTVLCDDGSEVVVTRDNSQYQITLK